MNNCKKPVLFFLAFCICFILCSCSSQKKADEEQKENGGITITDKGQAIFDGKVYSQYTKIK